MLSPICWLAPRLSQMPERTTEVIHDWPQSPARTPPIRPRAR